MKYRVTIEDWTKYVIDVEADNQEDAEERAWVIWENGLDWADNTVEVTETLELKDDETRA